jgi:hypothetical protein
LAAFLAALPVYASNIPICLILYGIDAAMRTRYADKATK